MAWEDSACPCGCGWAREKAWDPESDGWAVVREQVCYAGAARERWQREHDKPDSTEPGTLLIVVDERDAPATDADA